MASRPYHHKSILQPHNGEVLSNKIVGFADDLSLTGSREDLEPTLKVIDLYCRASRAKVNFNKSTVTIVSSKNDYSNDPIHGIKVVDSFVYLGIPFTRDGIDPSHWNNLCNKMVKRIQAAKRIFTCTLEMANIVNTYCLSLLWYPAPVVPINNSAIKKIHRIIDWALWSKDTTFDQNKIYIPRMCKLRSAIPRYENGPGLNIPLIPQKIASLKCKFLNELQLFVSSNETDLHNVQFNLL